MGLDFPQGWFIQLVIIFGTYIVLLLVRKGYKKKQEFKNQLVVGLLLLFLSFIGEVIGINLKLWTYFPNNWPITVWVGYFGIGLIAYQLVKLVDELNPKR